MHDRMSKILHKKRDLSENEKKAKIDVVQHLRDMASEAMGDKMDGLKKVSVMSDSPEGLKEGLDKAREVVSGPEMEEMKDHAENDMGDYKSALEEHSDDEPNKEEGFDSDENRYDEGGQVIDPQAAQSAQDSMRKAFKFSEGGEVDGDDSDDDDQEPETALANDDSEFHGLDEDEVDEKLQKLMEIKRKMESRKS